VRPEVVDPAAPAPEAVPEPTPEPVPEAPKAARPKADAFTYFFGHGTPPVEEGEKKPAAEKASPKPVSAFDYFFGKDGKAEATEPESPPPGE
jgi:hypothetical protein